MRFAAIADVHGNVDALSAVLDDMGRLHVGEFVNLGDHLSGPLAAAETADLLMTCNMPSIRGNCDRMMVEARLEDMGLSDRAAFSHIESHHLDWLWSLPITRVFRDDVFMCHGTPSSDTTYWLEQVGFEGTVGLASRDFIRSQINNLACPVMLCGHSHIPRAVQIPDGPLIVNPGSVGLPAYDHDKPVPHLMQTGSPLASYSILEKSDGEWNVTFRRVPYDTADMAKLAEEGGRPEWAKAIRTGWI